jgi:hypothetical protein
MSHRVLSDDESDHENGTNMGRPSYSIVQDAWRSEELIKWLRTIDLLSLGEKWDGRHVARRGNSRRLRVHSNRSKDDEKPVSGLPENCYDSVWLSSLKEYERNALQVGPPLDLTFSENERSYVFSAHCRLPDNRLTVFSGWLHNTSRSRRVRMDP